MLNLFVTNNEMYLSAWHYIYLCKRKQICCYSQTNWTYINSLQDISHRNVTVTLFFYHLVHSNFFSTPTVPWGVGQRLNIAKIFENCYCFSNVSICPPMEILLRKRDWFPSNIKINCGSPVVTLAVWLHVSRTRNFFWDRARVATNNAKK